MNNLEKVSYISYLKSKYKRANRSKKTEILTEIQDRLSCTRKHAIRLMNTISFGRPKSPIKRGRPGKYQDKEFKQALRKVWKLSGYLCSRSLKEAIPEWLPYIEQKHSFSEEIKTKLFDISSATIDRILKPYKATKGISHTRPNGFREEIPIQENIWDIKVPGYIEVDTVAHCGGSMGGDFINSLTAVDISSIWTEVDAVHGRGAANTFIAMKTIESELPFKIKGYDSDNGGEVLNKKIFSYFTEERILQGREIVSVTRGRPYKKNDNAHVEQRNDSIARRYLGYERLEFKELKDLISFYYRHIVCPLHNHFIPCFKLAEKIIIKGKKPKRVYKNPKTPYSRLIESGYLEEDNKKLLIDWHGKLNPLDLREQEMIVRTQIDKANRKLKSGFKLTERDLTPPSNVVIRPIFDDRPFKEIPLEITASKYAEIKSMH